MRSVIGSGDNQLTPVCATKVQRTVILLSFSAFIRHVAYGPACPLHMLTHATQRQRHTAVPASKQPADSPEAVPGSRTEILLATPFR